MSDVTQILSQIDSGDTSRAEQLLLLVYDELRKLGGDRQRIDINIVAKRVGIDESSYAS